MFTKDAGDQKDHCSADSEEADETEAVHKDSDLLQESFLYEATTKSRNINPLKIVKGGLNLDRYPSEGQCCQSEDIPDDLQDDTYVETSTIILAMQEEEFREEESYSYSCNEVEVSYNNGLTEQATTCSMKLLTSEDETEALTTSLSNTRPADKEASSSSEAHTESDNTRSLPIASSTLCTWRNESEHFDQESESTFKQASANTDHLTRAGEDSMTSNPDKQSSRSPSPTPSRISHYEATRMRRVSSKRDQGCQQSGTSSGESASSINGSHSSSIQEATNESSFLMEARELLKRKYDPASKLERITAVANRFSRRPVKKVDSPSRDLQDEPAAQSRSNEDQDADTSACTQPKYQINSTQTDDPTHTTAGLEQLLQAQAELAVSTRNLVNELTAVKQEVKVQQAAQEAVNSQMKEQQGSVAQLMNMLPKSLTDELKRFREEMKIQRESSVKPPKVQVVEEQTQTEQALRLQVESLTRAFTGFKADMEWKLSAMQERASTENRKLIGEHTAHLRKVISSSEKHTQHEVDRLKAEIQSLRSSALVTESTSRNIVEQIRAETRTSLANWEQIQMDSDRRSREKIKELSSCLSDASMKMSVMESAIARLTRAVGVLEARNAQALKIIERSSEQVARVEEALKDLLSGQVQLKDKVCEHEQILMEILASFTDGEAIMRTNERRPVNSAAGGTEALRGVFAEPSDDSLFGAKSDDSGTDIRYRLKPRPDHHRKQSELFMSVKDIFVERRSVLVEMDVLIPNQCVIKQIDRLKGLQRALLRSL